MAPAELAARVVAASVHCRHCAYELRGLRADALCPECGRKVWPSILHTVDPDASALPKLHDPRGVGNAVLWLAWCVLIAALLLSARVGIEWAARAIPGLGAWLKISPWLPVAAGIVALLGLWSVRKLLPPRTRTGEDEVRRSLVLLGLGLGGWSLVTFFYGSLLVRGGGLPGETPLLLGLLADGVAVIGLIGGRGVFVTIGFRSREYRTARGGRQSVQAMIAAVAGDAAGRLIELAAQSVDALAILQELGRVITRVSDLMLLVGLIYLAVNAGWIHRSLRKPGPSLEEVLPT